MPRDSWRSSRSLGILAGRAFALLFTRPSSTAEWEVMGQSAVFEPIVQRFIATAKTAEVVRRLEKRGGCHARTFPRMLDYFCQSGLRFISAFSLVPAGGGLSSAFKKAACFFGSRINNL